jgi:phosphatidylinositol alpha-1,6-mannosyltransferase
MKLVVLSSEFPPGPGGIGTHAYQMTSQLVKRGWQAVVVTPQDYAEDPEIKRFNADQPFEVVRSTASGPRAGVERFRLMRRTIKEESPDVVVATGQRSVWITAAVAARNLPWAAIGHGAEFGIPTRWQIELTRSSFNQAALVISVSEYTRSRMLQMGIQPKRDLVVPNGADASLFAPADDEQVRRWKERWGLQEGRLLLTVGNVSERKGQDVVIRALPHLVSAGHDVHYAIVGLPSEQAPLDVLARQLGVSDRVHFLGRANDEDLVTAYNACDVFVMTSRHSKDGDFEGYGIAAVEAAMCGKASVVSQGSGLEEAIVAGETGLSVPEGDPGETAAAVGALLEDDHLREKFGARARERALSEQTWDQRIEVYDEALSAVVREHSG